MSVARGFAGEDRAGVDGREWIVTIWRGKEGEVDITEGRAERRARRDRICIVGLEQMYVKGCRLGCEEPWDEYFGATIKLPRCSGVNANKAIQVKGCSTLVS